jgi:hypothetical protein
MPQAKKPNLDKPTVPQHKRLAMGYKIPDSKKIKKGKNA